jgi:hypothetical protein
VEAWSRSKVTMRKPLQLDCEIESGTSDEAFLWMIADGKQYAQQNMIILKLEIADRTNIIPALSSRL